MGSNSGVAGMSGTSLTTTTHLGAIRGSSLFVEDVSSLKRSLENILPFPDEDRKSTYKLPNSKEPGYSSIHINKLCHTKNNDELYKVVIPEIDTVDNAWNYAAKIWKDHDSFGSRAYNHTSGSYEDHYTYESFATIQRRRLAIGGGFIRFLEQNEFLHQGTNLQKFVLAIYSKNRVEWALTDAACAGYGIVSTALYDTLGPDSSQYILSVTESPIVVCSKDKIESLLQMKAELPHLCTIVSMDALDDSAALITKAQQLGCKVTDFAYIERLGLLNPLEVSSPSPDDLYTISFTSGTTGLPKGAMISHKAIVAAITFNCIHDQGPIKNKRIFSFLPLAHIFERISQLIYIVGGISVAFPNKDDSILTLFDNLKAVKPNILVAVPRLYNKLESALKMKVKESKMLTAIVNARMARHQSREGPVSMPLVDQLIIGKIRKAIGFDNMEWVISGSAPINASTAQFLRACLNVGFAQGYGATETCGGCCISDMWSTDLGDNGVIGASTQIRLRSLPELNYITETDGGAVEVEEPRGEILIRGCSIFSGYYKQPELTRQAFDKDGWFCTGDVGKIDSQGRVWVIDRVKNFFKLAQGEFVVPEKIENIYLSSNDFLNQMFIVGNSTETHLVGIVGIEKPFLESILAQHSQSIPNTDIELTQLANSPAVKKAILSKLNNDRIHSELAGFEKLHNIHVDIEPLKLEDDILTPTLKVKRANAKKFFQHIIKSLYDEGSLLVSSSKL